MDWEFKAQVLALECKHAEALKKQDAVMARVVQAMEENCQVLDMILALVITFMLPISLS